MKLDQNSIVLNSTLTSPKTIIEIPTLEYVDSLSENVGNRRDLLIVFNDRDTEFDNKLTNLDSIKVKRNASSDNELSNKKYIDDEIKKDTILRFNQSVQNYLKVSVGNDVYNLTKCDEIQPIGTTNIRMGNSGVNLLPYWKIICNDRNNYGKISNFVRSTKTNSKFRSNELTSDWL